VSAFEKGIRKGEFDVNSTRKRVVVTGGSGLLGRFVVAELESDHEITVIDTTTGERNRDIGPVDIRDLGRLTEIFAGHDAVIHLAALDSIVDAPPESFFDVNGRGTWSVLEAARVSGVETVVHCSSASVYGLDHTNPETRTTYLPIDEDHPIHPIAPYALAKRFGEIVGKSYAEKYGMNVCGMRLTGVVVPEIVDLLVEILEENADTWTNAPTQLPADAEFVTNYNVMRHRDYIDARDAARLLRAAINRRNTGYAVYNGAAPDTLVPYPTLSVVQRIEGALPEIRDGGRFRENVRASAITSARAEAELGWKARYLWCDASAERWASGSARAKAGG